MTRRDLVDFVLLAALWGASFLFMRVGAPEFGPISLIGLRVLIAAMCLWLLICLTQPDALRAMRAHMMPLAVVGFTNSALPFCLLAFATLSLTAGFTSLINASVPLWAALLGLLWLRTSMNRAQWLGLALGVAGMVILTWGKVDFKPGGSGVAILAGLVATLSYGWSTHFAKRRLSSVVPIGVATGSQTAAAIMLLAPTFWFWPKTNPSSNAWIALVLLGTFSTALAYILYFRLISRLGGQKAAAVTFLIPVFAALWGWVILGEAVTISMVLGGIVILVGTALTLGLTARRSS